MVKNKRKKKSQRKFEKKQAKSNNIRRGRGQKLLSVKGKKKQKAEVLNLSDNEEEVGRKGGNVEKVHGNGFLSELTGQNPTNISVEDFLQADFDDSSDSESEEALEEPPAKRRKLNEPESENSEKLDDVQQHKRDLDKLKEIDPEFWQTLKDNNLLMLGEGNVEEDDEEQEENQEEIEKDLEQKDEEAEGDSEEDEVMVEQESSLLKEFTAADLNELKEEVKKKPLVAFKKLVIAFKSATSLKKTEGDVLLHFADGDVFSEFMKYMIVEAPSVMRTIIKLKEEETKIPRKALHRREWQRLKPLCHSYLTCLISFLKSTTEETMQQFVLFNCRNLIPFLEANKKDALALIKQLVKLWINGRPLVRKDAFLTILEMCIQMHHDILSLSLKHMYLQFAKSVGKISSDAGVRKSEFLMTSLAEIYGVNPVISYQHGFVYIRQLAIHLAQALKNQQTPGKNSKKKRKKGQGNIQYGKDAHLAVYNWRFVGCLKSFVKIVCEKVTGPKSDLYPLVYPLVEIIFALCNMHKGMAWFPLKLVCIEMLVEMVKNCGIHIPLSPLLFNLLRWPGLRKKIKPSTLAQMDLTFILKINEKDLVTKAAHEALVEAVTRLFYEYFRSYAGCIAFPELSFPVVKFLKKELNNSEKPLHLKFKKRLQTLVKKLNEQSEWIKQQRQNSELTPKDITSLNTFNAEKSPLQVINFGKKQKQLVEPSVQSCAAKPANAIVKEQKPAANESAKEITNLEETEEKTNEDVVEELVLSDAE